MNDNYDWEELIDRQLCGELDEFEKERLARLLDSNAAARQEFVEHMQWDTEMAEALRDEDSLAATRAKTDRQWLSKPTVLRAMLGVAAVIIVFLSASLTYQTAYSERRTAESNMSRKRPAPDASIAKITGLSGSLIWTGDRGQIARDIAVGTELAGGTIEGMAPDSWFELQFSDGSTVMISGTSTLTFADLGQKRLRLREGRLSANVVTQPAGKAMLIHTRSALLEVLGTRFDVEANLASTVLNVSEGKVRLRRLADGLEVDVPAKHLVVAEDEGELTPKRIREPVHHWTSQLHLKPESYGKWQPATEQQQASLKAIPLIPPKFPDITLYLAGLSVHRSDASPVVLLPGSRFVVRGRLRSDARMHFGIRVTYHNGEFAGMFRGDLHEKQSLAETDRNGRFEEVYDLRDFTIDPAVHDRKDELAAIPDGLILDGVWAFTHTGSPSGLEITEVELVPPRSGGRTRQVSHYGQ